MNRMQRMAQCALQLIRNKNCQPGVAREYKARMNGFAVMVMQSGLSQASGFYLSKGNERQYADYLTDLVQVAAAAEPTRANWNANSFHQQIIECDSLTYRLLTRDSLAAAGWLKRYGSVYLTD